VSKKFFAVAMAFALSTGYSLSAFSQAKPEVLREQRFGAMSLQGKYLYALIPMASGKIPYDAKIVARNAAYLDVLTQMAWDGFLPSTAELQGTRASPEIYKNMDKFNARRDAMRAELAKFLNTVKAGDEASVKEGITSLNKTCNNCHDDFRTKR
jgi:cytochrome c556